MAIKRRTYTPLDYRTWILGDEARRGVNIKRLGILEPREERLLDLCVPYQDQRNDPGQAEIVAYFAIRLLEEGMPGKRDVAVPAAILHDTGWYGQGDPNAWRERVKTGLATEGEFARRPAQNRAVYLAGLLLEKAGYVDERDNFEIADNIGDHDTQLLPTTESGLVLRCADMMWRFTNVNIGLDFSGKPAEEVLAFLEGKDGYGKFVSNENFRGGFPLERLEVAMRMARLEIANTMLWRHPGELGLLRAYGEETAFITSYYGRD